MNEIISELKKSPIFSLSLSSKELFHSNFIAWICETYPLEFGIILSNYYSGKHNFLQKDIKSVQRESRNLDLTISFDSINLIIENKVKSTPNKQQLIDYNTKSDSNNLFILLTFIEPNFETEILGWELLTYNDLSKLLTSLMLTIPEKNAYHKSLLKDYINFILNLSKILNSLKLNIKENNYDYYSSDYFAFKEIRLHDLYIKHIYSELTLKIQSYLKDNLQNIKVCIDEQYSHEINENKIVISNNFVRGKGIINIDYSNQSEIILGIMLDGQKYNHYLYSWGEKEQYKIEIANKLRNEDKWFVFDNVSKNEIYPKKNNKGKEYNKFGNMIYRSVKIDRETQINVLFERIANDVKKLQKTSTTANTQ